MPQPLRKLGLTAHVAFSAGWLGAVAAYLALAVAGLRAADPLTARGAYVGMELVGWFVIVPCSIGALLTGLLQSLATEWGLFKYYWVQTKLFLTVGATAVLLVHMRQVSRMATIVVEGAPVEAAGMLPVQLLVHAAAGMIVLLGIIALSVFKPWGRRAPK